MERRVVITGLSAITPIGIGKQAFWESLISGKSGIDRITRFDTDGYATRIVGEVKHFDPAIYNLNGQSAEYARYSQLGLAATKMALQDAALDLERVDKHRVGVSAGVGGENISLRDEQKSVANQRVSTREKPPGDSNLLSNQIADEFGLSGPNVGISTACSAGNQAIGQARNLIRLGKADIVITGGAEAPIFPLVVASFCALRIMSKRNDEPEKASRPFDRNRDGFILSEGAGILVLETLDHALKRDAHIYGEIVGYGSTCDAYHMTVPSPDKVQIARAIKMALKEATLNPERVDYISAHGTSTLANDIGETKAIKHIFRDDAYKTPVSSIKSMIGHTIGAAGAIELIACALALEHNVLPPTINYEEPDPQCDLDYIPNVAREASVNIALSNSFGFGGNNSTIILKKVSS
ncbi:beta-ketoacyl-ACP synthase II [candidate division KSB1 bacterium]|nr:beta-ketoacyl-ACP synthase II [candidate division KSB1 bacterium]NIR69349.1 beta-ketoacyl-ACP synthase II [candidate division KSB1 bacterium]NIS24167.1 beta-ketoacyl-ACP synthase II [candidate division KSB1 bacterium]NIT71082.1 beta-ketoacyl-ACP synthase II [candidate division KSB1 bacterium]NIU24786.1 beta-ketoacyl-ACP synthase II [candidate division KSB1 bacterium]